MASHIDQAIKTLIEYYPKLEYSTLEVKGIRDPIFRMPIPVAPHRRGDIVISAHKTIKAREPYHRHDYFLINYVYRGECHAFIEGKDVLLQKGDIYLSQPFVPHSLLAHENPDDIILSVRIRKELIFKSLLPLLPHDKSLLDFFTEPLYSNPIDCHKYRILSGDKALNTSIHAVFQILILDYVDMNSCYETVMESALVMLFSFLSRCTQKQRQRTEGSSTSNLIDNILQNLSKNYATATLKDLAAEYGYHPNYLSTILQKETGKTFSQLIREFRLERACALLRNSDLPIEEIAIIAGYPHNSNFYKTFKKEYGQSASAVPAGRAKRSCLPRYPFRIARGQLPLSLSFTITVLFCVIFKDSLLGTLLAK